MIFLNQKVATQDQLPHLMLLLLVILILCYFDILTFCLITLLAFHKNVSSIRISKLHTCVLFIIFFSVSKLKSDLIGKLFIENQQAIKTNQSTHGLVTICPMKCLPLKIGVYIFFLWQAILYSIYLMITRSSDLVQHCWTK